MVEIRRSALVKYSPTQMFDLVNAVEAYPNRFGWCAGAQVLERRAKIVNSEGVDNEVLVARLHIKLAGFQQNFTTRNIAERPHRLQMSLVDGPFRALEGLWTFIALGDTGCKIAFALDFDYAGRLGATAIKLGFQGLATRMVDDFCREAERTYG